MRDNHSTSGVIKIRLRAFDSALLDVSVGDVVDKVRRAGIAIRGPIPLPVKRSRFTVNRGPHVDKKSREHFEIVMHKRVLFVHGFTRHAVEILAKLELPAGIDAEVKVLEDE